MVQELVLKGVNTALQDRNGNTPLHLACEQQSLECAQLLLLLEPVFGKPLEPRRTLQNLQLQNWQGEKEQSLIRCVHAGNIPVQKLTTPWFVLFFRLDLSAHQHPKRKSAADGIAGEEWSRHKCSGMAESKGSWQSSVYSTCQGNICAVLLVTHG